MRERERTLRAEIREGLLRSGEAHHKDIAGMVSDAGDESVANRLADVGNRLRTEYLRWPSDPGSDLPVSRWLERD